jgi:4-amino-4-deoxy-L-arabinose transferase-like glycosyltransferase
MERLNAQRPSFADGPVISFNVALIFLSAVFSNLVLAMVLPRVDWSVGTEITRIAVSVASGGGFSSPFPQRTGPSAWVPPVYPYLLAGLFRVFGVFTPASYWVAVALNIVVHAFSCVVLYWAAVRTFGLRTGRYAGMALATFPLLSQPLVLFHVLGGYLGQGLFIQPNAIWYTYLSELAILILVWLTLRQSSWPVYGVAWGTAALINPTVLALAPAFLAWRAWHRERWLYLGLTAATAALCVAPWLVRNYLVFHRPVFIRDGFGVELRVGNQPGSKGLWSADVHPNQSTYELNRVVELGEVEYSRIAGQEAIESIRSRPHEFVRDTILRVGYFWIGTPLTSRRLHVFRFLKYAPPLVFSLFAFFGAGQALKHGNREALLFTAVLLFYPLVYYVTHTFVGFSYQYAIQPEMLALSASVVSRENQKVK